MAALPKAGFRSGGEAERLGCLSGLPSPPACGCAVKTALSGRQALLAQLAETLSGKRDPYVRSRNLYKRDVFGLERRYEGNHGSMRSGERTCRAKVFLGESRDFCRKRKTTGKWKRNTINYLSISNAFLKKAGGNSRNARNSNPSTSTSRCC